MRSSALARNTTHDRKNSMDKRRVKIISRVLNAVNLNFPEAAAAKAKAVAHIGKLFY